MNTTQDFKVKNVKVSTDGHKKLYFDVELEGDVGKDYCELRVFDSNRECLEYYAYPSSGERIIIESILLDLKSKEENATTFYFELGVAKYTDKGELVKWEMSSAYEPVNVNIYYETHVFRRNVLEIG